VRLADGQSGRVGLVEAGDVRPLMAGPRYVSGLDWTGDGRGIVVSCAGERGIELRLLDSAGGASRALPVRRGDPLAPTVAATSLVYEESSVDVDIAGLALVPGAQGPRAAPYERAALVSTRLDYSADFAPDGRRIAFASARGGSRQIWLCDRDGGALRQLTEFPGCGVEHVRWAPDGRRLACAADTPRGRMVAVVDAEDGAYRLHGARGGLFQGWTRSGDAVYVVRGDGADAALWRLPLVGGEPVLVVRGACALVGEEPGGGVLYRRWDAKDIRRHAPGTTDRVAFAGDDLGDWLSADVADGRLHLTCRDGDTNLLVRLDPAATRADTLARLPLGMGAELAVASDGRDFLVHGASRHERDLVVVRDFLP
jgi:dipeptidyl aminopeptidase/acylaminoacyl peptidase